MKLFGFGRKTVRQKAPVVPADPAVVATAQAEKKPLVEAKTHFAGTSQEKLDAPLGQRGAGPGNGMNLRMAAMMGEVEIKGPDWSPNEARSVELLAQKYPRGPSKPGAFLRQDGGTHQYVHRVGVVDDSVLQSINDNGLRAAQATGTFGQSEGVYALSFDGGGKLPDPKLYGEAVYVLFESRHPCVVGDHLNKDTAVFPLDSGKHIGTENMIFVRGNKDGTYTRIDPNDSTKSLPLDLGEDGKTFSP